MNQEQFIPYPLKFEPIFKEKVWGGQHFKTLFGKNIPPKKKIGESWEISAFGQEISAVANGQYTGQRFTDLIKKFGKPFIGYDVYQRFGDKFPLLYKLIDAREPFSIQVHPSDSFAMEFEEGSWGKTEMWYIVHASPGAKIFSGLKDWVDEEAFIKAVQDGTVEQCLHETEIKAGDAFYIPAGRVHGTKGELVFFEIQENSDLSYRIYDWGRTGPDAKKRELHVDKALSVINYDDFDETLLSPIVVQSGDVEERLLLACDHFTVESLCIKTAYLSKCEGEKFFVLFVLKGTGALAYGKDLKESVSLKQGEFVYLPAGLGQYKVKPDAGAGVEILKTFVT
jgi:mannose-6-phosphate isomerase